MLDQPAKLRNPEIYIEEEREWNMLFLDRIKMNDLSKIFDGHCRCFLDTVDVIAQKSSKG